MNKMIKKFGGVGALLLVFGLSLVGCNDSENPGTGGGTGGGSDGESVSIELRTTAGSQTFTVLENAAATFMAEHSNINVTVTKYSGSYSDLASDVINGLAAGTHPDLAMVYPDAVADFINYGYAYNLEPFMNDPEIGWSTEDQNDIISTFLEEGQKYVIEGTYSLPFSKSTEVLYYNARILGVTIPGVNNGNPITHEFINSLTWEDFFDVVCPAIVAYTNTKDGKKLINKEASDTWAVLGYDSDDNLFITLAEQYGIPYTGVNYDTGTGSYLFNNGDMINLVTKWNGYWKQNYILTAGSTDNRANDYFKTNSILFSIGSTGGASYQWQSGMDVRVAAIPGAKEGNNHVILQGPSMAFLRHLKADGSTDTARQEASWLFYKHLTNFTNNLTWSTTGNYMPIRQSVYDSPAYQGLYDETGLNTASYDALTCRVANFTQKLGDRFYTSPAFPGSNNARTQVGGIITAAFKANATEATIRAKFQEAYNNCIANS